MSTLFKGKIVHKHFTTQMLKHTKLAEGTHYKLSGGYVFCNRGDIGGVQSPDLAGDVITSIFACLRSDTIRAEPALSYLIPQISQNSKGHDYTFCNLLKYVVPASIIIKDDICHRSHWDLSDTNQRDVQLAIPASKDIFEPIWCPKILVYCQNRANELEAAEAAVGKQTPSVLDFYRQIGSDANWFAPPTLHLSLPENNCTFVSIEGPQMVKLQRASGVEFFACCYYHRGFCEYTLELPADGKKGQIRQTINRHLHEFVQCSCGAPLPKAKSQHGGVKCSLPQGVCFVCTQNTTKFQALRVQQDMSAQAAVAKSNKLQEQLAELQSQKLHLAKQLRDSQQVAGSLCQDSRRRSSRQCPTTASESQRHAKKARPVGSGTFPLLLIARLIVHGTTSKLH
jgi:hypothetical protein